MSIGLLVRGNAPSLGAVVGAVRFAQGFALASQQGSQQGAGVVEHILDHSQFHGRRGHDSPRRSLLHKPTRDIGSSVEHTVRSRGQRGCDREHRVARERNGSAAHPRARPHRRGHNQRDRDRYRDDCGHAVCAGEADRNRPGHHPLYVRPPLHPLGSRRAGPLRRDTRPHLGWANVPCGRGSCKLRALHLVIEQGFLPGVRFGSGPGRSLMKEAERRQR
jgi:hypothetical protein